MKTNNPVKIITHHSNGMKTNACQGTQHHTVNIVDDHHKTKWPGFTSNVYKREDNGEFYHCGYHVVIWFNGKKWIRTWTRAIWEEGAHCIGLNTSSLGVLIMGNYDRCAGESIPQEAIDVWREVYNEIQEKVENYFGHKILLKDIEPHRKYATKSCHGNTLSDDFFRNKITLSIPIVEVEKLKELENEVSRLKKLVQSLSELLVYILNRSTSKRLSLRENKYV